MNEEVAEKIDEIFGIYPADVNFEYAIAEQTESES